MRTLNPSIFKLSMIVASAAVWVLCIGLWRAGGEERQGQSEAAAVEPARTLAHSGQVLSLGFSQDGNVLATGAVNSLVRLWDLKTGEVRRTLSLRTGKATTGGT